MSRITPIKWKILECIFLKAGFVFERQRGDHRSYSKPGIKRPVIIPTYKEVPVFIIKNNTKIAKMSREEYFNYLKECK